MKIRPLNDWAVVLPSEVAERTAGGIYIPDSAKEKPAEGVVEAIGPGALEEEKWEDRKKEKGKKKERKFIPTSVKPGERVMYERFAGSKITVGGTEYVLVRERSILGVFAGGGADPRPLMLPERTGASADTSIATLGMSAITAHAPAVPVRKAGPAAAKKKAAKKAAKKTAAKPKKKPTRPAAKKAKKKR